MLYVAWDGWMGWDWMVIIGHRSSKGTFGANNNINIWYSPNITLNTKLKWSVYWQYGRMYEQYSTVTKAKIMTWARAHLGVARVVDAGVAQQGEDGEEGVANLKKKLFFDKMKNPWIPLYAKTFESL